MPSSPKNTQWTPRFGGGGTDGTENSSVLTMSSSNLPPGAGHYLTQTRIPKSQQNQGAPHLSLVFREMWGTTAFNLSTLEPNHRSEGIDGCPRFAQAYLGRKRW